MYDYDCQWPECVFDVNIALLYKLVQNDRAINLNSFLNEIFTVSILCLKAISKHYASL